MEESDVLIYDDVYSHMEEDVAQNCPKQSLAEISQRITTFQKPSLGNNLIVETEKVRGLHILGLDLLLEIRKEANNFNLCRYWCAVCDKLMFPYNLITHLTCSQHKLLYVKALFPSLYDHIILKEESKQEEELMKFEDNIIKTVGPTAVISVMFKEAPVVKDLMQRKKDLIPQSSLYNSINAAGTRTPILRKQMTSTPMAMKKKPELITLDDDKVKSPIKRLNQDPIQNQVPFKRKRIEFNNITESKNEVPPKAVTSVQQPTPAVKPQVQQIKELPVKEAPAIKKPWKSTKILYLRSPAMTDYRTNQKLLGLPDITEVVHMEPNGNFTIAQLETVLKGKNLSFASFDMFIYSPFNSFLSDENYGPKGMYSKDQNKMNPTERSNRLKLKTKIGSTLGAVKGTYKSLSQTYPNLKVIGLLPHPINYGGINIGMPNKMFPNMYKFKTLVSINQYSLVMNIVRMWLKNMPDAPFISLMDLVVSKQNHTSFVNGSMLLRWAEHLPSDIVGFGYPDRMKSKVWFEIKNVWEANAKASKQRVDTYNEILKEQSIPDGTQKKSAIFLKKKNEFIQKRTKELEELCIFSPLFDLNEEFAYYWNNVAKDKAVLQNETKVVTSEEHIKPVLAPKQGIICEERVKPILGPKLDTGSEVIWNRLDGKPTSVNGLPAIAEKNETLNIGGWRTNKIVSTVSKPTVTVNNNDTSSKNIIKLNKSNITSTSGSDVLPVSNKEFRLNKRTFGNTDQSTSGSPKVQKIISLDKNTVVSPTVKETPRVVAKLVQNNVNRTEKTPAVSPIVPQAKKADGTPFVLKSILKKTSSPSPINLNSNNSNANNAIQINKTPVASPIVKNQQVSSASVPAKVVEKPYSPMSTVNRLCMTKVKKYLGMLQKEVLDFRTALSRMESKKEDAMMVFRQLDNVTLIQLCSSKLRNATMKGIASEDQVVVESTWKMCEKLLVEITKFNQEKFVKSRIIDITDENIDMTDNAVQKQGNLTGGQSVQMKVDSTSNRPKPPVQRSPIVLNNNQPRGGTTQAIQSQLNNSQNRQKITMGNNRNIKSSFQHEQNNPSSKTNRPNITAPESNRYRSPLNAHQPSSNNQTSNTYGHSKTTGIKYNQSSGFNGIKNRSENVDSSIKPSVKQNSEAYSNIDETPSYGQSLPKEPAMRSNANEKLSPLMQQILSKGSMEMKNYYESKASRISEQPREGSLRQSILNSVEIKSRYPTARKQELPVRQSYNTDFTSRQKANKGGSGGTWRIQSYENRK